jgi:hypothetical protein
MCGKVSWIYFLVLELHSPSLMAAEISLCTMLNEDTVVFDLIAASLVASEMHLHTMLFADSIVLDPQFASLVAAEHLHPLQEFLHFITHPYTPRHQHHFREITMPKICIKTNDMLYVHSIQTSNFVSKLGQTLLI